MALHGRGMPLLIVNGRMSERSFKGWSRSPRTAEALLSRVSVCLAQTQDDAERFARLGAPRVTVTGNLKYDSAPPAFDEDGFAHLRGIVGDRPLWVAASTHPGEDAMVARAHLALRADLPGLLTILVPRHPHRGGDVANEAETLGLRSALRSQGDAPHGAVDLYVADTLGELGLFYRLSPLVFLGGSLVPHGGQNPIEPIRLDAAVLHGPHVENFAQVYGSLDRAGGALAIADERDLAAAIGDLLRDPTRLQGMAAAGQAALRPFEGALDRTLAVIEPFITQVTLSAMANP
jgi:3-deoxy-D-manno-octulosonic-acid transferase